MSVICRPTNEKKKKLKKKLSEYLKRGKAIARPLAVTIKRVVIIITHRLDTISDVDKIFVMSEGRICEEGQHNELMKKGEKYYALVQNL